MSRDPPAFHTRPKLSSIPGLPVVSRDAGHKPAPAARAELDPTTPALLSAAQGQRQPQATLAALETDAGHRPAPAASSQLHPPLRCCCCRYIEFAGFHGIAAGMLVAVKQVMSEKEVKLFSALKLRVKVRAAARRPQGWTCRPSASDSGERPLLPQSVGKLPPARGCG